MLEADHFVSKTSAAELRSLSLCTFIQEEGCLSLPQKTPQQIYSVSLPENKSILIIVNLTPTTLHIIP